SESSVDHLGKYSSSDDLLVLWIGGNNVTTYAGWVTRGAAENTLGMILLIPARHVNLLRPND
ncbi:MAG: hypothetical protein VX289_06685, partial [Candidatus Poribacteria bacterium]|nr:hypothetical protein [Candidatus Poribacteria bacterium]